MGFGISVRDIHEACRMSGDMIWVSLNAREASLFCFLSLRLVSVDSRLVFGRLVISALFFGLAGQYHINYIP